MVRQPSCSSGFAKKKIGFFRADIRCKVSFLPLISCVLTKKGFRNQSCSSCGKSKNLSKDGQGGGGAQAEEANDDAQVKF